MIPRLRMPRPRTIAIIQARMGSLRFPRKVLADLAGQPVIWHLITRLRRCRHLDEVMLATSDSAQDDDLCTYVEALGARVVRGSESDVLRRLLKAAEAAGAEVIVRVTGDAPLVDPDSVDAQVIGLLQAGVDFCISEQGVPNLNEGFEAFTMAALQKLEREAGDDPIAVEHTCSYFKNHPGFVRVLHLPVPPDLQFSGARVSVDTPADLEFLNALHRRLGAAAGQLDVREVVRLLRAEPQWTEINAAVTQKKAGRKNRQAVIRCDASPQVGLGHLVRCLALAATLRDEQSMGITVATREDATASRLIAADGHRHLVLPEDSAKGWDALEEHLQRTRSDVLVLDLRDGVAPERLASLRAASGCLLVDIDDPEAKRLVCDLVFYPPVPQVKRMDWSGFTGQLHCGWDWIVLRRQFAMAFSPRQRSAAELPRLLVTMGGSDPAGMTLQAVRALRLVPLAFHAVILAGPAFCHHSELRQELRRVGYSHEVVNGTQDMAALMNSCDAALACFSVTAYELAALSLPAVYLSLSADHLESSTALVEKGLAISLGVCSEVDEGQIARAVEEILLDSDRRPREVAAQQRVCDGLGARRIAALIAQILEQNA